MSAAPGTADSITRSSTSTGGVGANAHSEVDLVDTELNEAERRLLAHYAKQIEAGDLTADDSLWQYDYITKPPEIYEFILDDYYLGRSLRPIAGENEGIWPAWLEALSSDFGLNSRIHNMVITGSLGIGKCLGFNDLCLMADGTKKPVQEIVSGDLLMGDDSTPRRVKATTKGRSEMYRIHLEKGEPFSCNAEHILCLKSSDSDTIEEVSVRDFLEWPRERKHKARMYRVGCDWPEQEVTLDPYWLGLWLGDGSSRRPELTSVDKELVEYFTSYALSTFGNKLKVKVYTAGKGAKAATHCLTIERGSGTNPLLDRLRAYGLAHASNGYEKFIPQAYLINSRAVRAQLLAGIIDTDGSKSFGGKQTATHAKKNSNGVYEVTVKLEKLADQIRFLALSLGYYAQTKIKIVNSTAYYRTIISGAYDIQSKLVRKQTLTSAEQVSPFDGSRRFADCSKTKFAIIPRGVDNYYGFTLDGNGRFLLGGFTVTHNTMMAVVLLLYRICIATHLKNPQNFFGISRNSKIVYNFLSVTKEAVRDTAFGDAMNMLAASPYFTEVCGFDPDSDYSGFRIPMLNTLPDGRTSNIYITAGSKGQHILGRNVVGVVLDEGNFRLEKDPDLKAYQLYDSVRTRISNRFQKLTSFLPALAVIASSAADESSFTEKVVAEIEAQQQERENENARRKAAGRMPVEPTQLVYRHAVYRIKRHALTDIGPNHRWFKVAHGLKNMEPFILNGWYKEDGTPIGDMPHEDPPSGAKTEMVPEFYFEAYKRNCRTNLQALSGISTGGAHRLFPTIIDIEWCLAASEAEGTPNPVKPGIERISLSNENAANIWDFLDHPKFVTLESSRYKPIRHPERKRYAHIDLATQSLAGVAVCHLVGSKLVEGLFKDGAPFSEYRLVVEYDFILTISAGETKPISIDKIQRFFFWLRDSCGFSFGKITADQYQCLTGDALVNTGRGLVRMDAVRIGDMVASQSGPRRVKRVFKYTDVPVLEVTTNHRARITGTPNHRISATHPRARWFKPRYEWLRLDELRVGDQVEMVGNPVSVSSSTPTGFTLDQLEWLGLFWANGCASERNGLRLSVSADDVADAVDLSSRAWEMEPSVYEDSDDRASSTVQIHSVELVRKLVKAGFDKPAVKCTDGFKGEIGLPNVVLSAPREEQARFLRGLYAGDGNVDKNDGCVSLSTKHRSMAEQVAVVLLTEFGVQTTLVESLREGYGGKSVQYILRMRGERCLFADRIGFSFQRKNAALDIHVERPGRQIKERVESIRSLRSDVYDIQVEDDPSYTANGFVSHNSEASLQMLEAKGFEVDRLSIDRDKLSYHMWREGFEEHRIRLPRNAQMLREAEALLEMDKKYDHPPDGCFTGDTRIALLDGTLPTFVELAERFPNGEKFPVFSVGRAGICVGWAHSPRITRRQAELVEVTLDNFQVIRCTPDHLFMTLSGEWVKAKNLTPAVSIMPLYRRRERKGGWMGYERVWCPIRRKRVLVHQLVAEQAYGGLDGRVVHHRDEVRHNNHPANLELMTKADHASHHTAGRHKNDQDYVYRLRSGHAKYRANGGDEKSRQNILRLYETGVLKRGKPPCSIEGCPELANARGLCGAHYQKWRRVKQAAERTSGQVNHSVLSVRSISAVEDVWDITVDETHNFALACGVFVHNSKDTTDAAAGAYRNAMESDEKMSLVVNNEPSVTTSRQLRKQEEYESPPVEIVLPAQGYTRTKVFEA